MPVVDWIYSLSPMLGEYIENHGWPPPPLDEESEVIEEDEDNNDEHTDGNQS